MCIGLKMSQSTINSLVEMGEGYVPLYTASQTNLQGRERVGTLLNILKLANFGNLHSLLLMSGMSRMSSSGLPAI